VIRVVLGVFGKRGKKDSGLKDEEWRAMNAELVELINARRIEEASALGQKVVEYVDKRYRKDAPEKATTYNNMGMVFLFKREYDMAEQCFSDALSMRKRLFGDDHNEVAVILLNLSQLYRVQAQEIISANRVETKAV
jgi:tetratricopeptide (TPR) repeat protein